MGGGADLLHRSNGLVGLASQRWVNASIPRDRSRAVRKIVYKAGPGFFINIVLGIVGGVVGGWLFELFGGTGVTGFNLWSMFVAVIGAVVVLVAYHLMRKVVD
jgi:uncharacterized membrane protein YeaQ/YmgE (transglycosylase-associated protein family)